MEYFFKETHFDQQKVYFTAKCMNNLLIIQTNIYDDFTAPTVGQFPYQHWQQGKWGDRQPQWAERRGDQGHTQVKGRVLSQGRMGANLPVTRLVGVLRVRNCFVNITLKFNVNK